MGGSVSLCQKPLPAQAGPKRKPKFCFVLALAALPAQLEGSDPSRSEGGFSVFSVCVCVGLDWMDWGWQPPSGGRR
jgi:hypothetical protein